MFKFKRKPKKQITLQGLYNAIGEVAKESGEDYYRATAEINNGILVLGGYINPRKLVSGKTIEEVCEGLRNYGKPEEPSPIKEVAIAAE